MRYRERVMLKRGPISRSQVGAVSSPDRQSVVRRHFAGAEAFLDLQRTHGNAFVQRLVQRKLAMSRGRDGYKQVADRFADTVARRKDASISIPAIVRSEKPGLRRLCTECEKEMQRPAVAGNEEAEETKLELMRQPENEDEEKVQRQVAPGKEEVTLQTKTGGALSTSGETENAIRALQGGGQPLPESVRAYFEPRMGYDFGGVRMHTGGHAAQLARSVNALAFTVGQNIAFGAGQYRPETSEGKRLVAHELTHVMQQTGSEDISTRLLRGLLTGRPFGQDVWPLTRRRHTEARSQLNVGPLVQRESLGTRGEAMDTYIARPGDSLSLIAGYSSDGWRERLDQLIAANQDHPNIKNRTPDDPQYGWLEIGDVINIPWVTSGTPVPSEPLPSTPASPGAPSPPTPAVGNSRCSVVITGGTKIGITKQFQLTATAPPRGSRGSYAWTVSNGNLTIVQGNNQPVCTFRAGAMDGDTDVTVTYTVGGRTCSATTTVEISKPTDEMSTFVRWKQINFTVGEWKGKLLPSDVDFSGITVVEIQVGPSADGCWFPGSTWDQAALSGGTWQIDSNNEYKGIARDQADADSVGWKPDAVRYYRNAGRVPCEAVIRQAMEVVPPSGPNVRYTTQDLKSGINPQDIYSERDGQRKSKGFRS